MTAQIATLPNIQIEEARRFTVEEYEKVLETGIFDDERVELLNGIIRVMGKMNEPHFGMIVFLNKLLVLHCAEKFCCSPQNPVKMGEYGAPMPDFVVAKFREDDYKGVKMQPEDILLAIEVADSSLKTDRQVKTVIYASNNIPEYWIVNLQDHQIEVFKQAKDADYQVKTIAKAGETVTCETIGFTLNVDEVFKGLEKA